MFSSTFLVTVLAITVAANPVVVDQGGITLELSRRVNATSVRHLLEHDQERAKALWSNGARDGSGLHNAAVVNQPVINQAFAYIANVGIGSPATNYELIIDTGSSNTWIGANKKYIETSTSTKTSNSVSVSYGTGKFSGTEYVDRVALTSNLVIPKQSIGVASSSSGLNGADGILGIGPVSLTVGTLSPASGSKIPTVTDNLFANGVITQNLVSVFYQPSTSATEANGELTWGGIDSSKIVGPVTYIPRTTTAPASSFWGIDQSIKYGSTTILPTTAGIVDTGTTLIMIATDAYNQYVSATGAVFDSKVGLLRITSAQFANLKSLFFITGGNSYELTPNAQIWPRSLNSLLGGSSSSVYLIVGDLGRTSGKGFDFINGLGFLERYYSVYDTSSGRVGFASTALTKATSN